MMFTHFFKFYNSDKGASSHSKQEEQLPNGATARKFLTINTQNSHHEQISKQERIMRSQYGRSMVEMLGVLAIIGVLSVGGIAGYSKAMMKYKMNKFTVAMNELLNTCIQYTGQLSSDQNGTDASGAQYLANILNKMHVLPDGIKYNTARDLTDMFGNEIWPYIRGKNSAIGYKISQDGASELSYEICHQLIKIAKENSSQLTSINAQLNKTDGDGLDKALFAYYGDASCTSDKKCIKNITISDIDSMCHVNEKEKSTVFYFRWE